MAKHLLNKYDECVEDAMSGALLLNPTLSRLEGFQVLLRSDIEWTRERQVSIISGGGSGHEPAHAGFIGKGMLSAAVLGNVFASPSVASILATLRTVTGAAGTLMVVKNYTGDRINFGMAMELARLEGLMVEMVIVDDDVALSRGKGITGGRGVAGTLFVHKIAGAAAEQGRSLQEIVSLSNEVVSRVRSMGVALSVCNVPKKRTAASTSTSVAHQRLQGVREIELGMGIHGEAGRETTSLPEEELGTSSLFVSQAMVDAVLQETISAEVSVTDCVLLLNNLGALPVMEMQVIAKDVIQLMAQRGVTVHRVAMGALMTALDMRGVSLSVLALPSRASAVVSSGELLSLFDALTTAPAWPQTHVLSARGHLLLKQRCVSVPSPTRANGSESTALEVETNATLSQRRQDTSPLIDVCRAVAERIQRISDVLGDYDEVCGDGDCGLVMSKGATALLSAMDHNRWPLEATTHGVDVVSFCTTVADTLSLSMGGTSGVLLELAFRSMSNHFNAISQERSIESRDWVSAMAAGIDAICRYGGADVGMRTMLDSLVPALRVLQQGEQHLLIGMQLLL